MVHLGRGAEALASFAAVLALVPAELHAHKGRGNALAAMGPGRRREALGALGVAVRLVDRESDRLGKPRRQLFEVRCLRYDLRCHPLPLPL